MRFDDSAESSTTSSSLVAHTSHVKAGEMGEDGTTQVSVDPVSEDLHNREASVVLF